MVDKEAVAPTCTETGLTEGTYCSVCDETLRVQTVIAALGHIYKAVEIAPTCTEAGYTAHVCVCGNRYVSGYVAALGHTEVVDMPVAPTCTETGLTAGKHCSVCETVLMEQRVVEKTAHTASDWIVDRAPTAAMDGERHTECTACGEILATETLFFIDISAFVDSVAALKAVSSVGESKYDAICKALKEYEKLSDAEKTEASSAFIELKAEIEGYNAAAEEVNEDQFSGIAALIGTATLMAALLPAAVLFKKRWF